MNIIDAAFARKLGRVRLVGGGDNQIVDCTFAHQKAEQDQLDLVLISEDTDPPVVKIQDFKKIQYDKKKARKASSKKTSLKEVQFKLNISDHDFETKLNNVKKFLERGDQVKITVRFKGRERENPERGFELIERVTTQVTCKVNKLRAPTPQVILEPIKPKK